MNAQEASPFIFQNKTLVKDFNQDIFRYLLSTSGQNNNNKLTGLQCPSHKCVNKLAESIWMLQWGGYSWFGLTLSFLRKGNLKL